MSTHLSLLDEWFRHDTIQEEGLHRPEVDEGPEGRERWARAQAKISANEGTVPCLTFEKERRLDDGSTRTYTWNIPKTRIAVRMWYFQGEDGNDGTAYRGKKAGTPRSLPDTRNLTAAIQARLGGVHLAKLTLSDDIGSIQRKIVQDGLDLERFPLIKKHLESCHPNQLYVEEKQWLQDNGRGCDCEECEKLPEDDPRRDVLHMTIDHDGPNGRRIKKKYGNLNPHEITDPDVMAASRPCFKNRCKPSHTGKDSSKICIINAGSLPNVNAAGTGKMYAPIRVAQYGTLVEVTLDRTGGQCASSGVSIRPENHYVIHKHHVSGTRAVLALRSDGPDLVFDMCKHARMSDLAINTRSSDFIEAVAREESVTIPIYGLDHEYFHKMENHQEFCEQTGVDFLCEKRDGYDVYQVEDLPGLQKLLEKFPGDEILQFHGVSFAKYSPEGELENVPKPPAKPKTKAEQTKSTQGRAASAAEQAAAEQGVLLAPTVRPSATPPRCSDDSSAGEGVAAADFASSARPTVTSGEQKSAKSEAASGTQRDPPLPPLPPPKVVASPPRSTQSIPCHLYSPISCTALPTSTTSAIRTSALFHPIGRSVWMK